MFLVFEERSFGASECVLHKSGMLPTFFAMAHASLKVCHPDDFVFCSCCVIGWACDSCALKALFGQQIVCHVDEGQFGTPPKTLHLPAHVASHDKSKGSIVERERVNNGGKIFITFESFVWMKRQDTYD